VVVKAPTPGLSALDQEREASMADEGGWSGAIVEGEERGLAFDASGADVGERRSSRRFLPALLAGVVAGLIIGFWAHQRGRDV
jgi:hypothetical protein